MDYNYYSNSVLFIQQDLIIGKSKTLSDSLCFRTAGKIKIMTHSQCQMTAQFTPEYILEFMVNNLEFISIFLF